MVKLEEVEDEELHQVQPGPEEEDDDYVDTDSSISEEDIDDLTSESLYDRLAALKDIIPPTTRRRVSSTLSKTYSAGTTAGRWGGKALWILTTTALLVAVPFTIAAVEEQQYLEQEKELKAQEGLRDGLTPGVQAGSEKGVGPTL